MWVRLCDLCGKNVDVNKRRILVIKQSAVLFYQETDLRFMLEAKHNDEITICENCAKGKPIHDLFLLVERKMKEKKFTGSPDA